MREFKALAIGGKHHGVVTHDIAAAEGVHSDFTLRTRSDVSFAAMSDVVYVGGLCFLVEDVEEGARGAGGGVDLMAVMHLGDLDVEGLIAKNGSGLTREMEEEINSSGEV